MNGTSPRFLRIIPFIILIVTTLACPVFSEDMGTIKKNAKQGNPKAQSKLGNAHLSGRGVPQDYAEAVKWLGKAAEQGLTNAQYNLGVAYADGQGVPQDFMLSYFWTSQAASRSTGKTRGNAAALRDHISKKLNPDQLMKAQHMTREWEAKHPRK